MLTLKKINVNKNKMTKFKSFNICIDFHISQLLFLSYNLPFVLLKQMQQSETLLLFFIHQDYYQFIAPSFFISSSH